MRESAASGRDPGLDSRTAAKDLCPNMKKRHLSIWVALPFFALIVYFFDVRGLKFYLVPSASMDPTLKKSDYIVGFAINPKDVARGDVVVFTSGRADDFYVKRVVGLPGETIMILNGYVYINGTRLDEPYVKYRGTDNFGPMWIPAGYVFIMGDNRVNSLDSRYFGPVPISLIETKVSFIYNPINRIGLVH